ncbi:MAG: SCO1664 family protein [Acidimicrobiia bacterium]
MPADELTRADPEELAGLTDEQAGRILLRGELEVRGRMPFSSNETFLVVVHCDGLALRAVYKPHRGERPLWDFPDGLHRREVAAYELSRALGWGLVPVTVLRADGPMGEGSLQRFVPADFDQHYFTLYEDPARHDELRRICCFDLVGNNTDRKAGHCLAGLDGRVHAIDNGLMFHREFKLRTVIWEFGGEPIPAGVHEDLARFAESDLPPALVGLLDPFERDALAARAAALARSSTFPIDGTGRRYPWPLV